MSLTKSEERDKAMTRLEKPWLFVAVLAVQAILWALVRESTEHAAIGSFVTACCITAVWPTKGRDA